MRFFEDKNILIKAALILLIIGLCTLSFSVAGDKFSSVETYDKTIQVLDQKKATVLGLTAASSSASIIITALPDDIGTPIADQLADITSYLLIALTVIYLEKYLLTIIGLAVFKFLIPLSGLLAIIYILLPKNVSFRKVSAKILAFGLVIFLVVPTSGWITQKIDETYQTSINETFSITEKMEEEAPVIEEEPVKEAAPWYQKALEVITNSVEIVKDKVSTSTTDAIENAKTMLNRFIEATAVMVVTSCIIPILTLILFFWLAKIVLQLDIESPDIKKLKDDVGRFAHLKKD